MFTVSCTIHCMTVCTVLLLISNCAANTWNNAVSIGMNIFHTSCKIVGFCDNVSLITLSLLLSMKNLMSLHHQCLEIHILYAKCIFQTSYHLYHISWSSIGVSCKQGWVKGQTSWAATQGSNLYRVLRCC